MIITCAIDNNYIRHCAVMLKSLYDTNQREEINVYIIHGAIDEAERSKLAAYLGRFLSLVSFIKINPEILKGFPPFGHLPISTYYRLLIPTVLPPAIQKVIFLDCDLVVADSLNDLWNMNLGDYPLAAVTDHGVKSSCERLGLSESSGYFNPGVTVIDLNKWRKRDILSEGLEFVKSTRATLTNCDQDVLNHIFEAQWLHLDIKWNACPHLWGMYKGEDAPLTPQDEAARNKPAIIHFAGAGNTKPWNYHCVHPWKARYLELKNKTPWARVPLESQPPSLPVRLWQESLFRLRCLAKNVLVRVRNLLQVLQVRRMLKLIDRRPLYLIVETINTCNAHCVFCCYGKTKMKPQVLPLDIFEKVIREYSEMGGGAVSLTPVPGEVLLDPHLIKRYEILAKYKNIDQVSFTTNGIAFEKYSDQELKYILRSSFMIQISIGGLNREGYKSLFQVDQFENVLNSISRLLNLKKAIDGDVHIHLAFRTNNPNFEDMHREQLEAFKRQGCLVSHISTYGNFGGIVKGDEAKDISIINGSGLKKNETCIYPLLAPSVLPNSSVTNCGCVDVNGDSLIIGDAHGQTLGECWSSQKRKKILRSFRQGKPVELCMHCSMYRDTRYFALPPHKNIRFYKKLPLEFYMMYGG